MKSERKKRKEKRERERERENPPMWIWRKWRRKHFRGKWVFDCCSPTVPGAQASVENLLEKDEEGKKKGLEKKNVIFKKLLTSIPYHPLKSRWHVLGHVPTSTSLRLSDGRTTSNRLAIKPSNRWGYQKNGLWVFFLNQTFPSSFNRNNFR